jgi:hypothetical protein
MSINQIALRNAFKSVKGAYASAGRNPIVTPSDLRLENPIQQNVNYYQFYALQSEQNPGFTGGASNTEIRLNTNDSFFAVLAGLYIAKPSSATSAEYILNSYPNPTTFTATTAAAYQMFFNNSTLNIAINNVQYIQNFLTSRFREVGVAQAGLGAASYLTSAQVASTSVDSFNGDESGITALGSIIEISGQKKADIRMNIPSGLSVAPGTYDRLAIVLRGFLALNAATR